METSASSIFETWKLCLYTSFLGCIILLFFLNQGHDSVNLASVGITNTSPKVISNGSNPIMQFLQQSNLVEYRKEINQAEEYCNKFEGKWVYDPEGSPLYNEAQCPFLSEQVSCQRNGRPDSEYEKWSWEANECTIPR